MEEADLFLEDMELGYRDEAIRGTRFVLFSGRNSEDMDILEKKRSDGYRNSHFKKTNIDCLIEKVPTDIIQVMQKAASTLLRRDILIDRRHTIL